VLQQVATTTTDSDDLVERVRRLFPDSGRANVPRRPLPERAGKVDRIVAARTTYAYAASLDGEGFYRHFKSTGREGAFRRRRRPQRIAADLTFCFQRF